MKLFSVLMGAAVAFVLTVPQIVCAADAAKPAFVIPHGTSDINKAIAGNYTLDPNHISVQARVSHLGFSISVFRFGTVEGKLSWDPANPAKDTLSTTVKTGSIETNVPNFATELSGAQYLDAAKYPDATFVSTAFHQTDATHGTVDGTFTLRGVTKPVTFEVTLVGAGPGFAGSPEMGHVIGVHAETKINPQDYAMSSFFVEPIALVIDTEFDRKAANNK
ncbi:MAG TPA: YceI family protein [Rhizomicrobium sp.]|jgi:polyisoprenoid-binding protein YceI